MIDKLFESKTFKKIFFSLLALFIFINATVFTVDQRQQALVLQFGEPVRLIKTPGLKFKMPFLQNAIFFDNRILNLSVQEQEVIASDQKRLIINAFAKYRIIDPLKFYTTVRSLYGAKTRLGAILDSSLRQIIGEIPLNDLLTDGRSEVMAKIKGVVARESEIFGIEIIDVRIVRGDLPKENSKAIFARMQTEREKEAREIRAKGAEEAKKIKAEADKERVILLAAAKKKSNIIKGNGDARATKIYADSYRRDPEFAYFYLSMQTYKNSLKGDNTRMVISPNSEFFNYLRSNDGDIAKKKKKISKANYSKKRKNRRRGRKKK